MTEDATTIWSNQELYGALRITCSQLKKDGLPDEAAYLLETFGYSSLPGELLGEFRVVIRNILTKKVTSRTRRGLERELAAINSALGPSTPN